MVTFNESIDEVTAFAPATVTNVSCGFDVFGFALHEPGDAVRLRRVRRKGVRIVKIKGTEGLPLQAEKNTAGKALLAFIEALNPPFGFEMEIHKKMAIGTGLGSSAASAAAAVFAANRFLRQPLSPAKLLPFALQGERLTSGESVHADNVAASLYGGFVLIRSVHPLDVIPLHYPRNLVAALIHPRINLTTSQMRRILRTQVNLSDAVRQWGNIAAFVAALQNEDFSLMRRSLNDVIIEPVRGKVIPGYEQAKEAALKNGALGSGISGSGPSIFALCSSQEVAQKAGRAMQSVFERLQIQSDLYISPINARGPKILHITQK